MITLIKENIKKTANGQYHSLYRCDCGNETVIRNDMRYSTLSCGCLQKEAARKTGKRCGLLRKIHGKTLSVEYSIWTGMKQRCNNPKRVNYKYYGGRGIKVCSEWLNSFEKFYSDMGSRPENKSLDRIDNDADYCKNNCKWSTAKEQADNRRQHV